jgi:hypothetical protein
MGRACSAHASREKCIQIFGWENQKEKDHQDDLDVGRRTILKLISDR